MDFSPLNSSRHPILVNACNAIRFISERSRENEESNRARVEVLEEFETVAAHAAHLKAYALACWATTR